MALEYRLGNFKDGQLTHVLAGSHDGTDKTSIDIESSSIELEINNAHIYKSDPSANLKEVFKSGARIVALVDSDAPKIIAAGFLNKTSFRPSGGYTALQAVGLEEYLNRRYVISIPTNNSKIADEAVIKEFSAGSAAGLIGLLVRRCFSTEDLPAESEAPPLVLGDSPTVTGDTFKITVDATDLLSYRDAIEDIIEMDGNGLEYRFVPRFADGSTSKVVWDLVIGSVAVPHINENTSFALTLNEGSKFSEYSSASDSRDIYNRLFINTVPYDDETKKGSDLQAWAKTSDPEVPLFEAVFAPDVELTQTQIDKQANARLDSSMVEGLSGSYTLEEQWDKGQWLPRVGAKCVITGSTSTMTNGESMTMRVVSIYLNAITGSVEVDMMPILPSYPRLPRKKQKESALDSKKPTVPKKPSKTGGGGTTPPPPIETGGDDKELGLEGDEKTEKDDWGNIGYGPGDTRKEWSSVKMADFQQKEFTYENFDGVYPVDATSITQAAGNRLYGLDRVSDSAATSILNGETTNYNGGVNTSSGGMNTPSSFFIKKLGIDSNGNITPISTVEELKPEFFNQFRAEFDTQSYGSGVYYASSINVVLWSVVNRLYMAIRSTETSQEYKEQWFNTRYAYNVKVSTVYKAIDPKNGNLLGVWQNDPTPIPMGQFPFQSGIVVSGDNVIFGEMSCHGIESHKNLYNWSYVPLFEAFGEVHKYFPVYLRNTNTFQATPPWENVSHYDNTNWPYYGNSIANGLIGETQGNENANWSRNFRDQSTPWKSFQVGETVYDSSMPKASPTFYPTACSDGILISNYGGFEGRHVKLAGQGVNEGTLASRPEPQPTPYGKPSIASFGGWIICPASMGGGSEGIAWKVSDLVRNVLTRQQIDPEDRIYYTKGYFWAHVGIPADYKDPQGNETWGVQGGNTTRGDKVSKHFNFRGRVCLITHSAQNKLLVRSIQIQEGP